MRKFENVTGSNTPLPTRSTKNSAGYDFRASSTITLESFNLSVSVVKTGIKCKMEPNEVLNLYSRSSMGAKGIIMPNSVGVIDADYYNNPDNEGEISFMFINLSGKPYTIHKGDRIGHGVFNKYFITNDDCAEGQRVGGIGSTGV